jgi:hypothetical protein
MDLRLWRSSSRSYFDAFLFSESSGRIWIRYQSTAFVGNPITISLVDDDEAIRRFVQRILQQQGFHVIEASDVGEA